MTRLTILEFPDPRLRTRATPVAQVDAPLRDLIDDMLETMYAANGIGLAATQVNVHRRLLVADVSEGRNEPRFFINPELLSREGTETMQEGCLSVPGYFDEVERAERVRVRALDRDGKLFVDYLSEMKRQRVRKKLEKERKQRAEGRAPESSRAPAI
jgi:peptide deformylase